MSSSAVSFETQPSGIFNNWKWPIAIFVGVLAFIYYLWTQQQKKLAEKRNRQLGPRRRIIKLNSERSHDELLSLPPKAANNERPSLPHPPVISLHSSNALRQRAGFQQSVPAYPRQSASSYQGSAHGSHLMSPRSSIAAAIERGDIDVDGTDDIPVDAFYHNMKPARPSRVPRQMSFMPASQPAVPAFSAHQQYASSASAQAFTGSHEEQTDDVMEEDDFGDQQPRTPSPARGIPQRDRKRLMLSDDEREEKRQESVKMPMTETGRKRQRVGLTEYAHRGHKTPSPSPPPAKPQRKRKTNGKPATSRKSVQKKPRKSTQKRAEKSQARGTVTPKRKYGVPEDDEVGDDNQEVPLEAVTKKAKLADESQQAEPSASDDMQLEKSVNGHTAPETPTPARRAIRTEWTKPRTTPTGRIALPSFLDSPHRPPLSSFKRDMSRVNVHDTILGILGSSDPKHKALAKAENFPTFPERSNNVSQPSTTATTSIVLPTTLITTTSDKYTNVFTTGVTTTLPDIGPVPGPVITTTPLGNSNGGAPSSLPSLFPPILSATPGGALIPKSAATEAPVSATTSALSTSTSSGASSLPTLLTTSASGTSLPSFCPFPTSAAATTQSVTAAAPAIAFGTGSTPFTSLPSALPTPSTTTSSATAASTVPPLFPSASAAAPAAPFNFGTGVAPKSGTQPSINASAPSLTGQLGAASTQQLSSIPATNASTAITPSVSASSLFPLSVGAPAMSSVTQAPAATTAPLFSFGPGGSGASTSTSTLAPFGVGSSTTAPLGNAPTAAASSFQFPVATTSGTSAPSSNMLGAKSSSQTGAFQPTAAPAPAAPSGTFMFGNRSTVAPSSTLASAVPSATTAPLWGSSTFAAMPPSTSASAVTAPSMFNAPSAQPAALSLAPTASAPTNTFSFPASTNASTIATAPAPFSFTASSTATTAPQQPAAPSFNFQTGPTPSNSSGTGFNFAGQATSTPAFPQQPAQGGAFSFGQQAAQPASAAFGQPSSQTANTPFGQQPIQSTNAFGSQQQPQQQQTSTQPNLNFGFGQSGASGPAPQASTNAPVNTGFQFGGGMGSGTTSAFGQQPGQTAPFGQPQPAQPAQPANVFGGQQPTQTAAQTPAFNFGGGGFSAGTGTAPAFGQPQQQQQQPAPAFGQQAAGQVGGMFGAQPSPQQQQQPGGAFQFAGSSSPFQFGAGGASQGGPSAGGGGAMPPGRKILPAKGKLGSRGKMRR
ncbi:hypothetical protein HDV00_006921 [Rhizophlyctis rosea]|nr:hypothetical protein HDV00_006921 [Rhizophlyctis rosea]